MKKEKQTKNPDTEQYIKDVRNVDSDAGSRPDAGNLEEMEFNDAVQEKNKKSQKDAETEAKFGDSSDPEKSRKEKVLWNTIKIMKNRDKR